MRKVARQRSRRNECLSHDIRCFPIRHCRSRCLRIQSLASLMAELNHSLSEGASSDRCKSSPNYHWWTVGRPSRNCGHPRFQICLGLACFRHLVWPTQRVLRLPKIHTNQRAILIVSTLAQLGGRLALPRQHSVFSLEVALTCMGLCMFPDRNLGTDHSRAGRIVAENGSTSRVSLLLFSTK